MDSDGLFAIGMLVAIAYGFYRLIKWAQKQAKMANDNAEKAGWRCAHIDEPNHDRIACYSMSQRSQALLTVGLFMFLAIAPKN